MPEPVVVQVLRAQKAGLLEQEQGQMAEMARKWLEVERGLDGQISALALEIQGIRERGEAVSEARLMRMERYQKLLDQAERETGRYSSYADDLITKRQGEMALEGIQNASEALRASGVTGRFDILPANAIEAMIGMAGNGSPLRSLLKESFPDAVEGLTQTLIDAIAQGLNPRDTARLMRDGFGMGLDRALNIARTEQLRAYRESNRMQYQESGLVSGYKRLAAHDNRTCAGCLFSEGDLYELDQAFEEHPSGRCTLVPVVIGMPAIEWENGQTWFLAQNEDTQEEILGAGYFEAWSDGAFGLGEMVNREWDEEWGGMVVPKGLRELVG